MQQSVRILLLCLLCGLSALVPAWAQEDSADAASVRPEQWRNFENLVRAINTSEQELAQLRQQLGKAQDSARAEQLRAQIDQLSTDIGSLNLALEMWATGGADVQMFVPQVKEQFDWRREIESIFEPIVVELRRLTERPRKIERLRSEQGYYQQRLSTAEAALRSVSSYASSAPSDELGNAFARMEERWRKRRDDLRTRLDLIEFELAEVLQPDVPADEKAAAALKELLTGRLLNLVLGILAAGLVYALLWWSHRLYSRVIARRGRSQPFLARVLHLLFVLFAVLLALLAGMAVFYVQGDWILLGLLIIVLVGVALAVQRFLPGYISQARLLLNIGPVREGERILYRGLPWLVQALNVSATLWNPELRGGRMRLPLSELVGIISRRADASEPWFPSREGDYVLLGDGSYGQVVLQTQEIVEMRILGAIKTWQVQDYLGQSPSNLSREGFLLTTRFGIDYQHQAGSTGDIPQRLEAFIRECLQAHETAPHLLECRVEFEQAGASSLDLVVLASFSGAAAPHYFALRRLLQRCAVDACNTHGWVIPFNQLTVHLPAAPAAMA